MIEVVTFDQTPAGVLTEELKRADAGLVDGVIVIALNKDGSQQMIMSRMSMHEKSFLLSFAQAWLYRWFGESTE
jgi:hypothetical protein